MKKILGSFTAATLVMLMVSCDHEIEPGVAKQSPVPIKGVTIATAEVRSSPVSYEAVGGVKSGTQANVSSKVMGEILEVMVEEGDRVEAGDMLASVDPTQLEAGLAQARAGRSAAWSQFKLARATYRRYSELRDRHSVSPQEFDMVEADYRRAQAASRQAEAAYNSAKDMLDDAFIKAPFAGVISAKLADVGDLATPGRPLFALESGEGYRVDLVVPEAHIGSIEKGQEVLVKIDSLSADALRGTVTAIAPAADQRSRSFLVKVALPESAPVKSGMFARVELTLGKEDRIVIPKSAVVQRGQLTGIYLVDEGNVTHFRLIRRGRDIGDQVEVVSGLSAGLKYVLSPIPELADGMKVEAGR